MNPPLGPERQIGRRLRPDLHNVPTEPLVSGAMLLFVAFLAFASLGLPDGVLGVAWPSVRRAFDVPVSGLGTLLAALMAGYLASSFGSGTLVARLGIGSVLLWSSALTAASAAGYALAPAWSTMIAAGVVMGVGAGGIDAGINAYAA